MGTKHVLIVDDAIDLGRLLQEALRTANPGLPIVVVPSAEEAILESTRLSIDLLITDIRLPGMTGLELVRKIRLRQPNIKVMVISGLAMGTSLQKQIDEINPDAFMHKPMSMADFLDTTSALLGPDSPEGTSDPEEKKPLRPVTGKLALQKETEEEKLLKDVLAQALPGVSAEDMVVKHPGEKKEEDRDPAREEIGLAGILSGLRSSLGAQAAMLLDERGYPVAQAGDLPGTGLMEQWVPSIMAALSAGARLSYLLGDAAGQGVQAYRGKEQDLVYAPVGQYALLVVLNPGRNSLRIALAFDEALSAQASLKAALEEMGLHIRTALEAGAPEKMVEVETEPAAAPELEEKDELLAQILESPAAQEPGSGKIEERMPSEGQRPIVDPDLFWDSAVGKEEIDLNTPGVLTYEQAQKLGLLPNQED